MFDKINLKEAINDLWDSGLRNDNLVMLYLLNKNNKAIIKTPVGDTKEINIDENVLQGGSWGPLKASNQMDTIGKESLKTGENVYMYRGSQPIAALEMVDDILAIAECGVQSIITNAYINTKVEMKNLKFGVKAGKAKCHQIHIGKSENKCPTLFAHDIKIEKVTEDTYVGDVVSSDGKFTKNIKSRASKATGMSTQIMTMLREVSLGYHYFNISSIFRNMMFNSSILTNSEVWYPLNESDLKDLISADKNILRKIFGVPVSTPIYLIYLESGEIPINYIIKSRRINYLHYLLNSPKGEMLSNVFQNQIRHPLKGDWVEIVKRDLQDFNINYSFEQIKKPY